MEGYSAGAPSDEDEVVDLAAAPDMSKRGRFARVFQPRRGTAKLPRVFTREVSQTASRSDSDDAEACRRLDMGSAGGVDAFHSPLQLHRDTAFGHFARDDCDEHTRNSTLAAAVHESQHLALSTPPTSAPPRRRPTNRRAENSSNRSDAPGADRSRILSSSRPRPNLLHIVYMNQAFVAKLRLAFMLAVLIISVITNDTPVSLLRNIYLKLSAKHELEFDRGFTPPAFGVAHGREIPLFHEKGHTRAITPNRNSWSSHHARHDHSLANLVPSQIIEQRHQLSTLPTKGGNVRAHGRQPILAHARQSKQAAHDLVFVSLGPNCSNAPLVLDVKQPTNNGLPSMDRKNRTNTFETFALQDIAAQERENPNSSMWQVFSECYLGYSSVAVFFVASSLFTLSYLFFSQGHNRFWTSWSTSRIDDEGVGPIYGRSRRRRDAESHFL